MKRLLCFLIALCLVLPAAAFAETADAVTSASVVDYFGTLMAAAEIIDNAGEYNGFFAVATVNPDNTPNIGFFFFDAAEYDGKLYIQFKMDENQTRANIENGSTVAVMYAPLPAEGAYATAGARLTCERVTDADLLAALKEIMPQESDLVYEVTLIRPLG